MLPNLPLGDSSLRIYEPIVNGVLFRDEPSLFTTHVFPLFRQLWRTGLDVYFVTSF